MVFFKETYPTTNKRETISTKVMGKIVEMFSANLLLTSSTNLSLTWNTHSEK